MKENMKYYAPKVMCLLLHRVLGLDSAEDNVHVMPAGNDKCRAYCRSTAFHHMPSQL